MRKKDKVQYSGGAWDLAKLQAHRKLKPSDFRRLLKGRNKQKTLPLTEGETLIEGRIHHAGIGVLCPDDPQWPQQLNALSDPPVLLYTQGIPHTDSPLLAIVGSRSECPYARRVARALVQKWIEIYPEGRVLSGGGLGVDAAAWRAALDFGVAPVMVLAHGLGTPHITTLEDLYFSTLEKGTLFSEALPFSRPVAQMFPDRNRLIAALADVVVVVRGAHKSGSLHTLNAAFKLGKTVFGVVGPVDDLGWFGIHDAIKTKKVRPLFHVEDLATLEAEKKGLKDALEPIQVPPQEGRILCALEKKPLAIDDITSILGLTAAPTMRLLLPLEIRGWIQRVPGGRFQISDSSSVRAFMASLRAQDQRQ